MLCWHGNEKNEILTLTFFTTACLEAVDNLHDTVLLDMKT